MKFKDYHGAASNHSYSPQVPACTYEKCSKFYHVRPLGPLGPLAPSKHLRVLVLLLQDQKQTPQHPKGDGSCVDECDCGKNPCGEYGERAGSGLDSLPVADLCILFSVRPPKRVLCGLVHR